MFDFVISFHFVNLCVAKNRPCVWHPHYEHQEVMTKYEPSTVSLLQALNNKCIVLFADFSMAFCCCCCWVERDEHIMQHIAVNNKLHAEQYYFGFQPRHVMPFNTPASINIYAYLNIYVFYLLRIIVCEEHKTITHTHTHTKKSILGM